MNTKSFAGKIKDLNNDNRWMVLVVAYFITTIISTSGEMEFVSVNLKEQIVVDAADSIFSIIISSLCCISFYDKFFKFPTQLVKGDVFSGGSIEKYMKYHGFQVEEYFSYIMKRFLPIQTVMALWAVVFAIVNQKIMKAIVGVIVFVIPFLVWKIRKTIVNYMITHRSNVWITFANELLKGICFIMTWIFAYLPLLFGVFAVYAIVENMFIPLNDDIAAVCINEGKLMMVFVFAIAVWPVILLMNERMFKKYHIKMIVTIIVFAIISLNIYSNMSKHTIIDEESIITVKDFKESTYYFDNVNKFEIYEDKNEGDVGMKFYFSDGEAVAVTLVYYSATEKWDYEDDYEYIKHIATKLSGNGVECNVVEPDKLLENLKDYWSQSEYENVKEIIELLSE